MREYSRKSHLQHTNNVKVYIYEKISEINTLQLSEVLALQLADNLLTDLCARHFSCQVVKDNLGQGIGQ
jgi:hypothetical protein